MGKEGIMIIGHGSKLVFNKDIMNTQADRLREMGFENVYIGFNETSYPTIEDSLQKMADDGMDTIYAMPLFIASCIHLTKAVPGKLRIPENSDGGIIEMNGSKITVRYGTPIGNDPYIAEILAKKIRAMK